MWRNVKGCQEIFVTISIHLEDNNIFLVELVRSRPVKVSFHLWLFRDSTLGSKRIHQFFIVRIEEMRCSLKRCDYWNALIDFLGWFYLLKDHSLDSKDRFGCYFSIYHFVNYPLLKVQLVHDYLNINKFYFRPLRAHLKIWLKFTKTAEWVNCNIFCAFP